MDQPKVTKETKNKIRVEFDRTPLLERLKAKFISLYFLKNIVWFIFRLIILIGICYIILFPFFSQIADSFKAGGDFVDSTVRLIPRNFTLETYQRIIVDTHYFEAFGNTFVLSFMTALIQTFVCCVIAYGIAKFKFRGNNIVFMAVILTMVIPHITIRSSLSMSFTNFDIYGIIGLLSKIGILPDKYAEGINLMNTHWPLIIMSLGGLAFKNGLYIFLLRQFFRGVPDELEESAYMDGSGTFRTFIQIILPLSVPMMITVFLFSFCWQWMDDFYVSLFYTSSKVNMLHKIISTHVNIDTEALAGPAAPAFEAAIKNTKVLLIIAPLVVLYAFCQRFLVQGIERSGLTAD